MEFSVFISDLLKELELVQGAIERKASVPVLSNVQDQSQSRSANQVVDQGWMNGIEPMDAPSNLLICKGEIFCPVRPTRPHCLILLC